ncbi:MAG: bifunctional 2-C-methyl-D-erythritol 4-phosphate cytidylyltransferase/2-C-methyl-D-erythritol 2,4-cyclodiphosphate synthase [Hyphomonadaceae bacterium]|nr:bifunctional 2-C-methyl-D-erythritol 4-phosphate cytidylyltransferase/2-C-methyl-D-erythritol 2,4-cyclodiphosphate synthase [Hyphomonadaceae bacterium]
MHNQEAFSGSKAAAIVVAAGSGTRLGGALPKQFLTLGGKPMLLWSVETLLQCNKFAAVAVVVPAGEENRVRAILPHAWNLHVVAGGASRTDSVRAGLSVLEPMLPDRVLIHDAARPGLSAAVIDELLAALDTADAAAPALAIADALKAIPAVSSVSRDGLVRVQTPQAFRWPTIASAYASTIDPAVDDLALVEAAGASITLTPGRHELMKVTYPEDFAVAEKLIAGPTVRVGFGFDVHGFEPGDAVILCGVRIPHTKKLEGHSDADAGWHALTDAILGALALGDIGDHFPPSDPRWKGAASVQFLKHAVKLAHDRGFRIANADITIVAERPKISPHREAMRAATAEAMNVPLEAVSVKATTTEKLGFVGREEGIAAQATVLLQR